jgi:hypothetical protein
LTPCGASTALLGAGKRLIEVSGPDNEIVGIPLLHIANNGSLMFTQTLEHLE